MKILTTDPAAEPGGVLYKRCTVDLKAGTIEMTDVPSIRMDVPHPNSRSPVPPVRGFSFAQIRFFPAPLGACHRCLCVAAVQD